MKPQATPLSEYQRRRARNRLMLDYVYGTLAFAGFIAGMVWLFTR